MGLKRSLSLKANDSQEKPLKNNVNIDDVIKAHFQDEARKREVKALHK